MAEKCEQLRKQLKKVVKRKPAASKAKPACRKKPVTKSKYTRVASSDETAKAVSVKARSTAVVDADGETALYEAVNSTLAAKASVIVKKLGKQAEAGNTASAKLLIEIMKHMNRSGKRASKRLQEIISTLEADSARMGTEAKSGG